MRDLLGGVIRDAKHYENEPVLFCYSKVMVYSSIYKAGSKMGEWKIRVTLQKYLPYLPTCTWPGS